MLRGAVEVVAKTYGYTQVGAYLREGDDLVLMHQVGYERVIERFPVTKGVCGRAVRRGTPILVEDVRQDPDFLGTKEDVTSEICVPLFWEGGTVAGFFNVESRGGVRLTRQDLRLMVALGEHISVAVSRAKLYTEARRSEQRFKSSFQDAPVGMALVGTDGRFLQVNGALCGIVGRGEEELLTKTFADVTHPDDVAADLLNLRRVLAGDNEAHQVEKRYVHKDGHTVWAFVSASLGPLVRQRLGRRHPGHGDSADGHRAGPHPGYGSRGGRCGGSSASEALAGDGL